MKARATTRRRSRPFWASARPLCATICALATAHGVLAQDAAPADDGAADHTPLNDEPSALDPESLAGRGVFGISLTWENDGSWARRFGSTDRFYSNGLKLDLSFAEPEPSAFTASIAEALGYDDPRTAFGLAITHRIYTPSDISITAPQPEDHPWAGHIGFGGYVQVAGDRVNGGPDRMDHLEFRLGWVGERAGAAGLQVFVHAAVPNQIRPRGWSNQLTNEVTAQLRWQRRWRVIDGAFGEDDAESPLGWDMIGHFGAAAGNEAVFAESGLGVRAGFNLPRDFGAARILDFRDATADRMARDEFSAFLFARGNVRLVAWDLFLDGNAFAAGSGGVDSREVVADVHVGLEFRYRVFELGYSLTYTTEQFDDQTSNGHGYGSIRLGVRLPF